MKPKKTMLFCTGYIGSDKAIIRYDTWSRFYSNMKEKLGYDYMVIIDDGSPLEYLQKFGDAVSGMVTLNRIEHRKGLIGLGKKFDENKINIVSFEKNLGRPILELVPGWWRSFSVSPYVAEYLGCDKIIHIESDAYILSDKLAETIRNENNGHHVLYSPESEYPETAIQWLNSDFYYQLKWFYQQGMKFWYSLGVNFMNYIPELAIKFGYVHREFIGDRYGDDYYDDVPDNIDYICNTSDISLNSNFQTKLSNKSEKIKSLITKYIQSVRND